MTPATVPFRCKTIRERALALARKQDLTPRNLGFLADISVRSAQRWIADLSREGAIVLVREVRPAGAGKPLRVWGLA